ncbi:MAG: undecaprenyl-diphosphatase UppP [Actinomycetota bacterium]|nr:undecaprenyl-diphosphatase UppP [Actinomycetota bacterium]
MIAAVVCGSAFLLALLLAAFRVGEQPGKLSDWQALVLGVVQGLTELLPISSSGHLILVPWLFDWRYLEHHDSFNKTFDVALHVGTLVAVVVYFRRDIAELIAAWVRSVRRRGIATDAERIAWYVLAATIPAAIVGAAGESFIEKKLGKPWQIAIFLAVFGVVLWIADRRPQDRQIRDLDARRSFLIGLAQVLALAPGVSRSGITISTGRFLGLSRDAAARFSFLLLVPIVFGASLLKGLKVAKDGLPPGSGGPFAVGMIAAAVTGMLAIWALLGYVRRHDYSPFVLYRLAVAAFVLILIAGGVRDSTF